MNEKPTEVRIPLEQTPACRVCGHKHNSWFEEPGGTTICDECLTGIPCGGEGDA